MHYPAFFLPFSDTSFSQFLAPSVAAQLSPTMVNLAVALKCFFPHGPQIKGLLPIL
jgi:hypothetical protein